MKRAFYLLCLSGVLVLPFSTQAQMRPVVLPEGNTTRSLAQPDENPYRDIVELWRRTLLRKDQKWVKERLVSALSRVEPPLKIEDIRYKKGLSAIVLYTIDRQLTRTYFQAEQLDNKGRQ